jgi:3-phenylpropionate/trans-cinnamate dioxygenase ferredoxin component
VPPGWVPAARADSIASGTALQVHIDGHAICLARVGDRYHAIDDTCTHEEASLSNGVVWEDTCEIECPLHDSTFNLTNGEPSNPPATQPVVIHRTRVNGEFIEIWNDEVQA